MRKVLGLQATLPGLPEVRMERARPGGLRPGQAVVYVGRVAGGPSYGMAGRVVEVVGSRARVQFPRGDRWLVPVALLALPREEARAGVA